MHTRVVIKLNESNVLINRDQKTNNARSKKGMLPHYEAGY